MGRRRKRIPEPWPVPVPEAHHARRWRALISATDDQGCSPPYSKDLAVQSLARYPPRQFHVPRPLTSPSAARPPVAVPTPLVPRVSRSGLARAPRSPHSTQQPRHTRGRGTHSLGCASRPARSGAAKRRQPVARGVSPWTAPVMPPSPEGAAPIPTHRSTLRKHPHLSIPTDHTNPPVDRSSKMNTFAYLAFLRVLCVLRGEPLLHTSLIDTKTRTAAHAQNTNFGPREENFYSCRHQHLRASKPPLTDTLCATFRVRGGEIRSAVSPPRVPGAFPSMPRCLDAFPDTCAPCAP
jgi:hypothetical protein